MPFIPDTASTGGFIPDAEPSPPNMGPAEPSVRMPMGPMEGKAAAGEGLLKFLSSMVAGPASKIAGSFVSPSSVSESMGWKGALKPEDVERTVASAMTYEPRTNIGKTTANILGYPGELFARGTQWAGQKTTEKTGSPMLGEMVQKSLSIAPYGIGRATPQSRVGGIVDPAEQMFDMTKPAPRMADTAKASRIEKTKQAGFRLTPEESGGGIVSRTAAGVAGEPKLSRMISNKNQELVNQKIVADLGLPEGTVLDFETLSKLRAQAGKSYQAVRDTGIVQADPQFFSALDKIAEPYQRHATDFPQAARTDVLNGINGMKQPVFNADSAVTAILDLRDRAGAAYAGQNKILGRTYSDVAKAFEDMLDRHLVATGQSPALIDRYRSARTQIAKSYEAQGAMNPATGDINPQKYAAKLAKGKPLSGGAKEVGEAASAFPRSLQKTSGHPSTAASYWDIIAGGLSHEWPLLFARPLMRAILASKPGQAMIGTELTPPIVSGTQLGVAPAAMKENEPPQGPSGNR